MSSAKEPAWTTTLVIVFVAGLLFYGMTRGPGTCPASLPRSASVESVPLSSSPANTQPTEADSGPALVYADDSNFDEVVLQAKGPVLVDFYADWCGPCQQLAPVLERVSQDLTEGRIVKVNVDQNPQLAARYNIQALPTLLVFVDGQVVQKAMGMQSEQEIRSLLQ